MDMVCSIFTMDLTEIVNKNLFVAKNSNVIDNYVE